MLLRQTRWFVVEEKRRTIVFLMFTPTIDYSVRTYLLSMFTRLLQPIALHQLGAFQLGLPRLPRPCNRERLTLENQRNASQRKDDSLWSKIFVEARGAT